MIKRTIAFENQVTGGSIENAVQFITFTGTGSFSDSPPHGENICETCHTKTAFHRFDGSTAEHFDAQNCTLCHNGDNSWLPGP